MRFLVVRTSLCRNDVHSHRDLKGSKIEQPSCNKVAKTLILGVRLQEKNLRALTKARTILEKYPKVSRAQQFLRDIDELEKESS